MVALHDSTLTAAVNAVAVTRVSQARDSFHAPIGRKRVCNLYFAVTTAEGEIAVDTSIGCYSGRCMSPKLNVPLASRAAADRRSDPPGLWAHVVFTLSGGFTCCESHRY